MCRARLCGYSWRLEWSTDVSTSSFISLPLPCSCAWECSRRWPISTHRLQGKPRQTTGPIEEWVAEGRSFCVPLFVYHFAFKINVFQNELNVKHQWLQSLCEMSRIESSPLWAGSGSAARQVGFSALVLDSTCLLMSVPGGQQWWFTSLASAACVGSHTWVLTSSPGSAQSWQLQAFGVASSRQKICQISESKKDFFFVF